MSLSVRIAEPMCRHTALRTGGRCGVYAVAHDEEALLTVLRDCKAVGWRITVLGAGTRTVFRDGPIEGCVLRLGTGFVGCRIVADDLVFVGAMTPVPALLSWAADQGLQTDDALIGVPGSLGGSLFAEDWDVVSVRLARVSGVKDLEASRVGSKTKGVVVGATIRLERVGDAVARTALRAGLRRCALPPGSWVMGHEALRDELRRAALDQVRLRQVAIPPDAPELIVNLGGGTARDMQLLHKSALERVKRTRGLKLSSRKKWIGTHPREGTGGNA